MVQNIPDSPDEFLQAVLSSRQLQSMEYSDPNQNKDSQTVGINKDMAAGVIAQIWGREARAGVQNLIGLMTVISVLTMLLV